MHQNSPEVQSLNFKMKIYNFCLEKVKSLQLFEC